LAARGGQLSWYLEAEPKARHGRRELRAIWALSDPELNAYVGSSGTHGRPWPHLAQLILVERHRLQIRQGQVVAEERERIGFITSVGPERFAARGLLQLIRGHWRIENQLHWVRDVVFDEDRCQVRGGAGPEVLAGLRNVALRVLRQAGITAIAPALRTFAARPHEAIALVLAARSSR
jgi:hypothetical protein